MAANADGPKSGSMGFGYLAAKAAGIPWEAVRPRSDAEAVAAMNEAQERRKFLNHLKRLHPELKTFIEHMREVQSARSDTLIREALKKGAELQDAGKLKL